MSIDITTIGVGVDTSKLKAGTRDLDAFGNSADKASRKADGFSDSAEQIGKQSSVASAAVTKLGIGLASVVSVGSLARTIDEYTKFNAQLKNATKTQEQYTQALADVQRVANTTQSSISAISTLYARLNSSLGTLNISQQKVANISEVVALGLKINGASASETASAMMQLSQAFASGVLRGDEFNSMAENALPLMQALADSIGIPLTALRDMAHQGQLTSEVLAKAFGDENLLEKFRKQGQEIQTLSGAWETFRNRFVVWIGDMDKSIGASKYLAKLLNFTGQALFPDKKQLSAADQNASDQKELAFLSTPGALGIREGARLEQLAALRKKLGITGNQLGGAGAITGGTSPYPNFNSTVVPEDINKIHQQQEEALRIKTEAQKKYEAEVKKSNDAILKSIQDDIDTETEEKAAKEKYLFDLKKQYAETMAKYGRELSKEEVEAYKAQLKHLDELQDIANKNFKLAQDAYDKQQAEMKREFDKTIDGLDQTFREGFASMINGGTSSWKAFTKQLYTQFKTAVAEQIYNLFARPYVIQLVASLTGLTASGGASAASSLVSGSSSSGGGFLGAGKSIFDAIKGGNASIVSGIENLGAIIANGNGGLRDMLGGFIGQNAGLIADILPYSGAVLSLLKGDIKGAAFQGAGVAIGSYFGGPIGGAIGGAIGSFVGGLVGGGGHKETYAYGNVNVSQAATKFSSNSVSKGNGGGAGGYDVGVNVATYLGDAIRNLSATFGGTIDKAFNLGATYSSKYQKIEAFINNGGARKGVGDLAFDLNKGLEKDASAQAFFVAVKKGLVTLPNIIGDIIKRSDVTLTNALQSVTSLQEINAINQSLKDLPPVFKSIGEAIKTIKLSDADALKARFSAINTYTGLFYTDAEKIATFTKQMTTTFTGLGVALPSTRDGFRNLVDGLDTSTASGLGLFNALVDLAPTADAYYKALQAQSDATKQATENAYALADALNTNKFKNVVDFTRAQRYQQNGIPLSLLPSYDVGTSYVPNDGPAMLHQGEAVLTKAENAARNSGGDSEIKSLLQQLIFEVRAGNLPQIQAAQKMAKILDRIDQDGIVLSETDRSGDRVTLDTRVVA